MTADADPHFETTITIPVRFRYRQISPGISIPEASDAESVPAHFVDADRVAVLIDGRECALWSVSGQCFLSRGRSRDEFIRYGWLKGNKTS